jgi:hypothetical protein
MEVALTPVATSAVSPVGKSPVNNEPLAIVNAKRYDFLEARIVARDEVFSAVLMDMKRYLLMTNMLCITYACLN